MPIDITIPSPGESITEVVIGPWHKTSGDWVERDETIVEIESDKITLEVPAAQAGVLTIAADEGAEMQVGEIIGSIDPDGARPAAAAKPAAEAEAADDSAAAVEVATATASAAAGGGVSGNGNAVPWATPLARKVAADKGVPLTAVRGTGPSGRITKSDVLARVGDAAASPPAPPPALPVVAQAIAIPAGPRAIRRERMSRLRRRIAERLVEAQHQAAMLTTFNEADMSAVMDLRRRHKESFQEKHGVKLGFMSFFVTACVSALREYPGVNAFIDGDEVEYHDFMDISVAVGTPRGLVVPVVRNAELLSFAGIESAIKDLALRAQGGKLTLEEMTGGTFTITNGGTYGSLMSTQILNPPQSGILGMHRIMNRAVEDPADPGQVVLRPMMYLALSYDHRIVDGEQAVRFLVHVKQCLEDPQRLMLEI